MATMATGRIGIGLAALGRPAYINIGRVAELPAHRSVAAMRAATHEVLDAAYAKGIRWVDVARSYGRAEEFLAEWLEARGHNDVTVSSKWGYEYVGQWQVDATVHESKEHSLARFQQQWERTRELLGPVVGLYQVHSLTADSSLFSDRPLLDALAGLADAGVRVGFSTSGPGQGDTIRRAAECESGGQRIFSAVQSTWNLLEPSVGSPLAEVHEAGMTVLLKEVFANGRLVLDPPAPIRDVARAHGVGADAIALAAALSRPWADTVLVGPASTAQLADNLRALDLKLTDEELTALSELRELPVEYWARRSALAWQ